MEKKIKPNCWYIVENAKWVEVDFSDDIFYVLFQQKEILKSVKTIMKEYYML